MTSLDPRVFGRYEIRRKLAGGGMGRVFLAHDPVLNRLVGLKLIDSGTDQESQEVIAAERRGAMLQDQLAKREPGGRVAQIFDVGESDGYFYIAMEYIEGEDLSELVARGPLHPPHAVSITLDILEVLAKAHTFHAMVEDRQYRGIIHGDIKPRNIRITPQGHVKVLDFGIAKAVSMTRSVTFNQFGSVPYSSPERLQTGDMDARSDVWSVGIVLFEMLAGRSYFQADASSKLEWFIRNYKAVQPAVAALPAGLRDVLSRALHPDINRRFTSASEFQAALIEWHRKNPVVQDGDATRRTVHVSDDATRRTSPVVPPDDVTGRTPVAAPPASLDLANARRLGIAAGVLVFALAAWGAVSQISLLSKARQLAKRIDTGQVTVDQGNEEYRLLANGRWFSWPLLPARNSLRDRYITEADRVIADYREAGESTPVYTKDWKRAQAAVGAAVAIAPDDSAIRGRSSLINGHLKLRAGDLKSARASFEDARARMPKSPDPHLGLAIIHMSDSDLDKAEEELNEAQRKGFHPGRREQKSLADAYKKRGERWIAIAKRAHDIGRMQDALKKADGDLEHAQSLYNAVAPFFDGSELSEKVAAEREQAVKTLEAAHQAQAPRENQ